MKKTILIIAALIVLSLPGAATAGGEGPELDLGQCVEIALSNNRVLLSEAERLEAAKAGLGQAAAGFMPRVDVSETYVRSDNPVTAFGSKLNQENFTATDFALSNLNDPEPIDNFNFRAQLTQPVFNGGKQWLGLKRARLGLDAAGKSLERARQETVFEVVKGYYGVVLAGEYVGVAEKAQESTEAHLKAARDFYDQGMAVVSEVLLAKVRLAEVTRMRVRAESGLATAKAALNMLMGRDQDTPFSVSGGLSIAEEAGQLEGYLEAAARDRPDLAGMDINVEDLSAKVRLAGTDYLPHINFVGRYELDDDDPFGGRGDSYTLMGVINWNIFDGFLTTNRVREARAGRNAASHMRDQMREAAMLEVRSAYYEMEAARLSVEAAAGAVEEGEESLRVLRRRFEAGMAKTIDVLDSETALTRARTDRVQALYDYSVARARLRLATGSMEYRDGPRAGTRGPAVKHDIR